MAAIERAAILLLGVYLAVIGTWKLRVMVQVRKALQTHSKRIAAILDLVSRLPDGSPTQQAGRRAQLFSIVQQAREEMEETR